jgi:hypothetical protein
MVHDFNLKTAGECNHLPEIDDLIKAEWEKLIAGVSELKRLTKGRKRSQRRDIKKVKPKPS